METWDSQTADAIIAAARARGHRTLDEHASKQFLACFGIPVCRETIAAGPEEAARAAVALGFPVVAKACGASLAHKTEMSAVALDLRSADEVREAGRRLGAIPGAESLLVQELVPGNRELLCGSTRKPGFGPCIVFGVGGVLTEAIDDISLRLAPLTTADAAEMVDQIRLGALLGPFRGAPAVDRAALGRILVALGDIAHRYPGIAQIDVNPLKVRPDGSLVAVDALVVLQEEAAEPAPVAEPSRSGRRQSAPLLRAGQRGHHRRLEHAVGSPATRSSATSWPTATRAACTWSTPRPRRSSACRCTPPWATCRRLPIWP